jgi:hypothetical protein
MGENVTEIVHTAPGASMAGQLFVSPKDGL